MFQSVRINNPVYILHKDTKQFDIGYVTNIVGPKPKYSTPLGMQNTLYTVDISVNINGNNINYNEIPSTLDIVDFNNDIISDSKEAMNNEILNLKQKSIDIINSRKEHEDNIIFYDKVINKLNPEYAEKIQQKNEIEELKNQIAKLTDIITNNLKNKEDKSWECGE